MGALRLSMYRRVRFGLSEPAGLVGKERTGVFDQVQDRRAQRTLRSNEEPLRAPIIGSMSCRSNLFSTFLFSPSHSPFTPIPTLAQLQELLEPKATGIVCLRMMIKRLELPAREAVPDYRSCGLSCCGTCRYRRATARSPDPFHRPGN